MATGMNWCPYCGTTILVGYSHCNRLACKVEAGVQPQDPQYTITIIDDQGNQTVLEGAYLTVDGMQRLRATT